MKSKPKISIQQTGHPLFNDVLSIIQCFDFSPETPNNAASLSLIFDVKKLTENQKRLGDWLVRFIEPFILNPIRNEQNLQEKTLAVATYLFISSRVDLDQKLPDEYLIKYIEYASSQSWFEDHFLAFYCHFLKDQIDVCKEARGFFEQNYERFLSKKHIPAISQSLIVLDESISETERKRGYELLESLLDERSIFSHIAWGLWAFSARTQIPEKLIAIVQERLNNIFSSIRRDTGVFGVLALFSIGSKQMQIQEYLDEYSRSQIVGRLKITIEENSFTVDTNSLVKTINDGFTIFDLCVVLIGLRNSKQDQLAYIIGLDDEDLIKTTERIKKLSANGGIDLSRAEKNIFNTLIILVTFLVFCLVFYFQIGGTFNLDLSELSIFNWSIEEIVISLTILDFLLGTIQTVRIEGNAVKGLLQWPLFRHWQSYQKSRRKG